MTEDHDADRSAGHDRRRPEWNPAPERRDHHQRRDDDRTGGGDEAAHPTRTPEAVLALESLREQADADRAAEVRGGDRVDERADGVAGRDVGVARLSAAGRKALAPGSSGAEKAESERGCGEHEPAGLGAAEAVEGAAERAPSDPRRPERETGRHE